MKDLKTIQARLNEEANTAQDAIETQAIQYMKDALRKVSGRPETLQLQPWEKKAIAHKLLNIATPEELVEFEEIRNAAIAQRENALTTRFIEMVRTRREE